MKTNQNPRLILWAGKAPNRPIQSKEIDLKFVADRKEAVQFVKDYLPAAVISAFSDFSDSIDFLLDVFSVSNLTVRFIEVSQLTEEVVRQAVNQAQVMAIFDGNSTEEEILVNLMRALDSHQELAFRRNLLERSKKQLRELESLNLSLESLVEERTQHIESSRLEEEDRLNKSRSFVKFIKEVSIASSFEEFLAIIRKEFRRFGGVGEPFLILQGGRQDREFLYVNQGQLAQMKIPQEFKMPEGNSGFFAFEKYFANYLGRPVLKTLVIPISMPLSSTILDAYSSALIGVEISIKESEFSNFIDFINERHQVLNIAADRLLLESELSTLSYRWEKIFDNLKDPIAIIDVEFHILRANKKFWIASGKSKCFEVFAQRNEPCQNCPIQGHKQMNIGECQVQINGRNFEVHSFPIWTENGKATNFVNLYLDTTQKRELYLRMLQSEKIGAIGMLAGNIAHELNNPLTGIHSLAQLLQSEVDADSGLFSDLKEIEKAAQRSQDIIKNLLEFSIGESNGRKLVVLDDIINKTLPLLKTAIRSSRYNLSLKCLDGYVSVEPQMLQQVVFNLINNACQAIGDKGLIEITTWKDEKSAYLSVEDDGPGVPEELVEKIFEPFFTTKKEGKGTGLGLSLAKKVVETYQGRIIYEARKPRGSRFVVSLPLIGGHGTSLI